MMMVVVMMMISGMGNWTQGLKFAGQVLYQLNPTYIPLLLVCISDKVLHFCPGRPQTK
jgi:hypothetical protein